MLSQNREVMMQTVVKARRKGINGAPTHVLMLDDDMVFPKDTLHRLLQRKLPVVGVNYVTKEIPAKPVAVLDDGETRLYTDPDSTGCVGVGHLGLGITLVDPVVLLDIPQPWFPMEWREDLHAYSGEDVAFCRKLREAGVPIVVDQDLSKEVAHIGGLAYRHDLVGEIVQEETQADRPRLII